LSRAGSPGSRVTAMVFANSQPPAGTAVVENVIPLLELSKLFIFKSLAIWLENNNTFFFGLFICLIVTLILIIIENIQHSSYLWRRDDSHE
jgi:hypothetical protein